MSTVDKYPLNDDYLYGRTATRDGLPWIVPKSLEFLDRLVDPSWLCFEWGAGGSTVYFARNCQHITSIEHNSIWIDRVTEMLKKRELLDKVDLRHVKGLPKEVKDRFKPYANTILEFPDNHFDCVLVDGEASSRGWCLRNAESKVKEGGIIVLDNSQWVKRELDNFDKIEYVERGLKWIGQKGTFEWWTTIYRKKKAQPLG